MKGYLIKDYRLLIAQKNLLIILPIGLIFLFTNDTPVLGISYTLYVITFLCNSLMAYDSFDNGMPFLMTLPGGRKAYVTGKYLFNIITSTVTALFLLLLSIPLELHRGSKMAGIKELFFGTIMLYAVALIFSAVMLPILLKYGHEKSRVVLMIFFGIVFLGSMGIGKIASFLKIDPAVVFEKLNQIPISAVMIGSLILMIIILFLSWAASQKIMSRKNF